MSLFAGLPVVLFLSLGLVPSGVANRHFERFFRFVFAAALTALVLAVIAAGSLFSSQLHSHAAGFDAQLPLTGGVYFDGLSAVMLVLISALGLVIIQYSHRYLATDPARGRFLRWICVTLGGISWFVVAGDLATLTLAWMLTSFGLHQLLTHYGDRSWAIWAARKKFLISRIGDLLLLAALALTYATVGSVEFAAVFEAAAKHSEATRGGWEWSAIAYLFVLGAMTKSAQVPFHSWLPDTMETPTPVSALMHAGIINAGGFLVLRLSPVIVSSPAAMNTLACCGALTALFGSVVMLTQTSIKRSLAYSTIAQMGFMMLQCGLGAFSAALLHLVAHSVYKAHAFLRSGSITAAAPARPSGRAPLTLLPVAALVAVACVLGASWTTGVNFASKAGGPVLGFVLAMALTHLIWQTLATLSPGLVAVAVGKAATAAVAYCVGLLLTEHVLSAAEIPLVTAQSLDPTVAILVALGFLGVFVLQAVAAGRGGPWLSSLFVHAMNGFYLDIPARRITARFWGLKTPVP